MENLMENRDTITELEEKVADEVKLDVKCECEPNDTDDDSDKDAPDGGNNYPPIMDMGLIN